MKNFYLCVLFLIASSSSMAEDKRITIAFGDAIPPWVLENGDGGILIDLVKDCLEPSGYIVDIVLLPYARRLFNYSNDRVDSVSDINQKVIDESNLSGYFTGDIYAYTNYFFSLAKNNLSPKNINDMKDYSIVSWQGAKTHIGGEYRNMAEKNTRYTELANQESQVRMLFKNRIDFAQLDMQIFKYYKDIIAEKYKTDTQQEVDVFEFLGKNSNGFLFKTEDARDSCLKNLNTEENREKYQQILVL